MNFIRSKADLLSNQRKVQRSGNENNLIEAEEPLYNNKTKAELVVLASNSANLAIGVRRLMSQLFTEAEIANCSIMGKFTNKKASIKSGLDESRRNLCEEILVSRFNVTVKEVREKMRSRQKIIQRYLRDVEKDADHN